MYYICTNNVYVCVVWVCVCALSVQRVCGWRRFLRFQLLLQLRAAYGYVVQCRCAYERSGSGVTANIAPLTLFFLCALFAEDIEKTATSTGCFNTL